MFTDLPSILTAAAILASKRDPADPASAIGIGSRNPVERLEYVLKQMEIRKIIPAGLTGVP